MNRFKSWEELAAQWEEEPKERPSGLLLSEIVCCPEMVSFRDADAYPVLKHAHDLTQRLKRTRSPFAPLLVARAGGCWVLLDGYLRWAAYSSAGWTRRVPVCVFSGSPADALLAVVEANSRLQLALTPEERSNAAWRLVRLGAHTKATIAKATGTGSTSVARMRKQLKALLNADLNPDHYPEWRKARSALEDREPPEPFDVDSLRRDLAERLVRAWGPQLRQQPQVCAEVLYQLAGHQAQNLAQCLADLTGLIDLGELEAAYEDAFQFRSWRFPESTDGEKDDF